MIDSVLKGTGNSRFLKSAVPAGTSWADALAMLQAGTFPIDFNGINTEGFQQVGTPLNKANLLKDATAAQIGLPPSTTPDGMFQALGNTGELHVWRKTVMEAQEIPAGYKLVPVAMASTILMYLGTDRVDSSTPVLYYATEINISNNGNVAIESNGKLAGWYGNGTTTISNYVPATGSGYTSITDNDGLQNLLRGKFITLVNGSNSFQLPAYVSRDKIYQIPSDATISFYHGYSLEGNSSVIVTVSKLNEVVGYPLTPAETTTTYPVSTNPKAYQEGDDAKAAGYVVGEVKSGKFRVSSSYANGSAYWKYGTSLTVSDDGTVNIANPSSVSLSGSSSSVASNAQQMAGKYAVCTSVSDTGYESDFPIGTVVFFPSDTLFTRLDSSCWASKYQPVTGYAAIPAGTTIEYLGKLGDKGRMQTLTYVGTGTYGSEADPITLTFPFAPKYARYIYNFEFAEIPLTSLKSGSYTKAFWGTTTSGRPVPTKISEDRKTLSWYGNYGADYASNSQGTKYHILIIG